MSKSRFPRDRRGFIYYNRPLTEREEKHIWIFPSFSRSNIVLGVVDV